MVIALIIKTNRIASHSLYSKGFGHTKHSVSYGSATEFKLYFKMPIIQVKTSQPNTFSGLIILGSLESLGSFSQLCYSLVGLLKVRIPQPIFDPLLYAHLSI